MDLTHTNNRQALITEVYEKVDRAFEDAQFIDVPQLTRTIFDIEGTVSEMINTPEFNAVCGAVDFLINEGSVFFDSDDGGLTRV